MTASPQLKSDFFTRALTAVAMLGPILLLFVASSQPPGMRGEMTVLGDSLIVAGLLAALALRGVYALGFIRARKLLRAGPNRSLTA